MHKLINYYFVRYAMHFSNYINVHMDVKNFESQIYSYFATSITRIFVHAIFFMSEYLNKKFSNKITMNNSKNMF